MTHQGVIQAIFDGILDKDARRDAINQYHDDAPFKSAVDLLVHWLPLWVDAMAKQSKIDAENREQMIRMLEHGIDYGQMRDIIDKTRGPGFTP
jgi:hypothetical protein